MSDSTVNQLIDSPIAEDDHTDDHAEWADSLTDYELADALDAIGDGELTPPERAATLAEAARRLRRIHTAAAIPPVAEVEATACYVVEF